MRRFVRQISPTQEERVGQRITQHLSDLTLDLDEVGHYIARTSPTVIYKRFITVAEAALYEKELRDEKEELI